MLSEMRSRQTAKEGRPMITLIESSRPLSLFDCRLIVAREPMVPGHVHVDDEVGRIKLEGSTAGIHRFGDSPRCHQMVRMPMMRMGIVRIKPKGAFELLFREVPLPEIVRRRVSERGVCLGKLRLNGHGFERCRLGLGKRLPARQGARLPRTKRVIDIGESRLRESKARITRRSPL